MLDRFARLDHPDATAFLLRAAAGDSVRHDALRLLGRFTDERARFALQQWLRSPAGEQDQLLRAMGRYRDEASLPEARRWLASPDSSARLHAAFLLAALGQKEGGDVLLAALEEAPTELKRTAARLLSELEVERIPDVAAGLTRMLEHPDVYVRLHAARALAERGDARAFATLERELGKKIPFVRDEVLDLVERLPPAMGRPVLQEWSKRADPLLRLELERILEKSRSAR